MVTSTPAARVCVTGSFDRDGFAPVVLRSCVPSVAGSCARVPACWSWGRLLPAPRPWPGPCPDAWPESCPGPWFDEPEVDPEDDPEAAAEASPGRSRTTMRLSLA